MTTKWTPEQGRTWYDKQPWIVGCNFIPSTAGNQMEMWLEATFDRATIERELGWARALGMNAVRVFLHDQAWQEDPSGFLDRIDIFLQIAASHGIRMMPVLFDDCWFEREQLGPNPEPQPGVHNSMWLQSPGRKAARDKTQEGRLEAYVKAVVSRFANDERILLWDLYNEVGNSFLPTLMLPNGIRQAKLFAQSLAFYLGPIPTLPLLRKTASWARECNPSQPLTSSIWFKHPRLNRELIGVSDIISFHNYRSADELEIQIKALQTEGRPLLCTEYLARTIGNTFASSLPVFKKHHVACFNWGLVSGRTQTIYSWTDGGRIKEPTLWYHDIFRIDGTAFDEEEIKLFAQII